MKYVFITYDGYPFPIAKQLIDEGNEVYVCQIEDRKQLEVDSGLSQEETAEEKERRLSIYEGIVDKLSLEDILDFLKSQEEKGNYFLIFDYNNLYKIAEKILKMGYTKGLFPLEEDFELEKDRQSGKDFVKKYYKDIKVAPVHEFHDVESAIEFLNESEGIFALKSEGNYADTVVPLTNDDEFGKRELIGKLRRYKEDWEKGIFTLEQKIKNPIEVAPEIVFWNGEPIYTQIEIETRMLSGGDTGFQTGGNQNLVIATPIDAEINRIAFPPIVYERAKKRKGMYIFDCGILYDEKGVPYFTEFAGNRWGWGGIFSEISMSRRGGRVASEYFESIANGENPQKYKFGSTLSLYNLEPDSEFAKLYKQGIPVMWKKEISKNIAPYQITLKEAEEDEDEDEIVNTGYPNNLFGYTTGYGDTLEDAAETLYSFADKFSFNGVYYRSKEDFLSKNYRSSIPNRFNFLEQKGLLKPIKKIKGFSEALKSPSLH